LSFSKPSTRRTELSLNDRIQRTLFAPVPETRERSTKDEDASSYQLVSWQSADMDLQTQT
jgi:hypothetical protein